MGKLEVGQKLFCKGMFGDYEAFVQKVGTKWKWMLTPAGREWLAAGKEKADV